MIIFTGLVIAIFLAILGAAAIAINNFDRNVQQMFQQSKMIKGTISIPGKESLPIPVWNYFNYALKRNLSNINYVRLKHRGKFKTTINGTWQDILGEEYFTVNEPGFIWKGRVGWLTAIDSFVSGKGSLSIYFLSFLRLASGSGPKFAQGELLRWLGESVWFPTALLPSDNIQWLPIDESHAKLEFSHNGLKVDYIITFNDESQITTLETMRYMDGKKMYPWIGKLSNYKMWQGIMIPSTMEAVWKMDGIDFPYAVFELNLIEYDKPSKFS